MNDDIVDDADFIQIIQAQPNDVGVRLAYADWLDDHGDIRGEFLRLQLTLANASESEGDAIKERLAQLRGQICPDWLAEVDRAPIENCDALFSFLRCPRRWESVEPLGNSVTRFCASCEQAVHYCASMEMARFLARRGHRVAVASHLPRAEDDLHRQLPVLRSVEADDF